MSRQKLILIFATTLEIAEDYLNKLDPSPRLDFTGSTKHKVLVNNDNNTQYLLFTNMAITRDFFRGLKVDHLICVDDFPDIRGDTESILRFSFDRKAYVPLTDRERIERLEQQVIKLGGTLDE